MFSSGPPSTAFYRKSGGGEVLDNPAEVAGDVRHVARDDPEEVAHRPEEVHRVEAVGARRADRDGPEEVVHRRDGNQQAVAPALVPVVALVVVPALVGEGGELVDEGTEAGGGTAPGETRGGTTGGFGQSRASLSSAST
jgi:hypothetical protein